MAFTPGNLSLKDREWAKFVGATGTGSEVSVSVTLASGTPIVIGSVSASVDSVYIQSGANLVGSAYCFQQTNPWIIGSQANLYVALVALQSGTSNYIPLQCNADGMLLTSGI